MFHHSLYRDLFETDCSTITASCIADGRLHVNDGDGKQRERLTYNWGLLTLLFTASLTWTLYNQLHWQVHLPNLSSQ